MPRLKLFLLMLIFLIFCMTDLTSIVLADARTDAENAVNSAHRVIVECYKTAADAQKAGANVTDLLNRLNEAGEVYSKAVLAFKKGNYNLAVSLANESQIMLENFVEEANGLKEEANRHGRWDFMVNFVGSIVGAVSVIVVSFSLWTLLKRKRVIRGRRIRVEDYSVTFLIITFIVALIVASPALSRILVYPRTEFFTELWILDENHKAENYPFNITKNNEYTIYLGIGNHLGYCAYYVVQVKFRNESQPAPTSFGPIEERVPSNLTSLFNITAFVADEEVWEISLTFSIDYTYDANLSRIEFGRLELNDVLLDLSGYVAEWNATRRGCYGFLFFELWLYNDINSQFEYHGRFVGLWLNMTVS